MPTQIRVQPRPPRQHDDADDGAQVDAPPALFDGVSLVFTGCGVFFQVVYQVLAFDRVWWQLPDKQLLAFWVSLALLLYGLVGRPLARAVRRAREESTRLREAMTCPYCRDRLDDAALLCGRSECGAIYHPECWEECRQEYGGCAIYGCGHAHATEVGRFALQRRLARLVLAAVLFPPRAVARLRELEGWTFRQVWDEAKEHQTRISEDEGRTVLYGGLNLLVSFAICGGLILLSRPGPHDYDASPYVMLPAVLSVVVVPLLLLRFPLARAFGWGSAKVVARAFRGELGALNRADAGTVLGRLLAGVAKKG